MLLLAVLCAFPVFYFPSGRVEYHPAPDPTVLADTIPDWGDDILVGMAGRTLTTGKLAADADTSGNIYVGLLEPGGSADDQIHIWRSTNGGISWDLVSRIATDDPFVSFADYELRAGSDANGTWLHNFVVANPPGTGVGLWLLRFRPTAPQPTWVNLTSGDTVLRVAADLNVESPQHLFAAWETRAGEIHLAGSSDSGQTWHNHRVAATGSELPALAAGGDGAVYVACNSRDSSWVQVTRYDDNLAGTDSVTVRFDSSAYGRPWAASVAADRDTPRSSQAVVVLYCSATAQDTVGVGQSWSRDGGQTWRTDPHWPPVNRPRATWDARLPRVRRAYNEDLFRAIVTMPDTAQRRDSLIYAYSRPSGPGNWEGRRVHNDYRMTVPDLGAQVGYSWLTRGGYFIYARDNTDEVWFDCYRFVTVGEERPGSIRFDPGPTISRGGVTRLGFVLASGGKVTVSVFDAAGRTRGRIPLGYLGAGSHSVEVALGDRAGVYHCLVEAGGEAQRTRVIRLE